MRREPMYTGFRAGRARCECGNPKERGAEACVRCLGLDGGGGTAERLLAILRRSGPLETLELGGELGIGRRQVLRIAGRLLDDGDVFAADGDSRWHEDGKRGGPSKRLWSAWPICFECRSAKVRTLKVADRRMLYCGTCDRSFEAGKRP